MHDQHAVSTSLSSHVLKHAAMTSLLKLHSCIPLPFLLSRARTCTPPPPPSLGLSASWLPSGTMELLSAPEPGLCPNVADWDMSKSQASSEPTLCVGSRNGIGEGRFRVPEINCLKFVKKERWQSECGSVNV